jgi:hypothetical protein
VILLSGGTPKEGESVMATARKVGLQIPEQQRVGNLLEMRACGLSMTEVEDWLDWCEANGCLPPVVTHVPENGFAVWEVKPSGKQPWKQAG